MNKYSRNIKIEAEFSLSRTTKIIEISKEELIGLTPPQARAYIDDIIYEVAKLMIEYKWKEIE